MVQGKAAAWGGWRKKNRDKSFDILSRKIHSLSCKADISSSHNHVEDWKGHSYQHWHYVTFDEKSPVCNCKMFESSVRSFLSNWTFYSLVLTQNYDDTEFVDEIPQHSMDGRSVQRKTSDTVQRIREEHIIKIPKDYMCTVQRVDYLITLPSEVT